MNFRDGGNLSVPCCEICEVPKARSDAWDKQIEEDIKAGRLDHLREEILEDIQAGRLTEL